MHETPSKISFEFELRKHPKEKSQNIRNSHANRFPNLQSDLVSPSEERVGMSKTDFLDFSIFVPGEKLDSHVRMMEMRLDFEI